MRRRKTITNPPRPIRSRAAGPTHSSAVLALNGGRPEQLTLADFLRHFISFREEVVARRTAFELRKARERSHILCGLAVAVSNVDEVVATIRSSADPAEARTIIRVLNDETGRRTLTVTARNVPAEFEVWYRVTFSVDVNGKEAVPSEEIFLTRDYPFDETQVLGKSNEEQLIMQAIARDMVGLLSRRLAAID